MTEVTELTHTGVGDDESTLLESLVAARAEAGNNRETFILIPGYEDSGVELLAKYRLMSGPEIETIARKNEALNKKRRQQKGGSRWQMSLNLACDVMIAACEGIYFQRPSDDEPLPLTFEGAAITGFSDPNLANALQINAGTARQAVVATFCDNELAVSSHSVKLNRWFQNTNASVDDEFLGE